MKKPYYYFILFFIFIILVLTLCTQISAVYSTPYISYNDEIIYSDNNTFIVPSGFDLTKVKFHSSDTTFVYESKSYRSGDEIDITQSKKTETSNCISYEVKISNVTYTFIYEPNLAHIQIDTILNPKSLSRDSKDDNCALQIYDKNGKIIYDDVKANTGSEIKVRGNMTSTYQKKPFQIKLAKKTNLFNMGKAKTWILLANYIDPSFIRNYLAFSLGDELGLDFSPKSEMVLLYMNGRIVGLYQLTEKTQINTNRIEIDDLEERTEALPKNTNIDKMPQNTVKTGTLIKNTILTSYTYISGVENPSDITGGYLVELDNLYSSSERSKFSTSNGNTYVIKSPENASKEQVEYIAEIFADMEEAIYSETGYNSLGLHYSEYMDVDSFAKFYSIEELTKEWDAYVGSTYFYKDKDTGNVRSKVFAGPLWDFDNSFGTLNSGTYSTDLTGIWTESYSKHGRPNGDNNLGCAVSKHAEMKTLISKYTNEGADLLISYSLDGGKIDELSSTLSYAVYIDRLVWGYKGRQGAFLVFENYTGTGSAIEYLKNFALTRARALKDTLSYNIDENEYFEIHFDDVKDVKLNSQVYKAGNRASFVYYGNIDDLVIKTKDGNNIAYDYNLGYVSFIMPNNGAYVYSSNTIEETTNQISGTTQIEETTGEPSITETETTLIQTETVETTNVVDDDNNNGNTGKLTLIIVIAASFAVILAIVIIVAILIRKKKVKNTNG